jgi:hypothetical protein
VLRQYTPFASATSQGNAPMKTCLEVASGTGQHCSFFAEEFPHIVFQPTEYVGGSAGPEEPAYGDLAPVFASIVAHCGGKPNVRQPLALDAAELKWPEPIEASTWDAICEPARPFSLARLYLACLWTQRRLACPGAALEPCRAPRGCTAFTEPPSVLCAHARPCSPRVLRPL